MGSLDEEARAVLTLRAGLGRGRPLSRAQVARRVRLTRAGVRRIERRGLRTLREAARSSDCERSAGSLFGGVLSDIPFVGALLTAALDGDVSDTAHDVSAHGDTGSAEGTSRPGGERSGSAGGAGSVPGAIHPPAQPTDAGGGPVLAVWVLLALAAAAAAFLLLRRTRRTGAVAADRSTPTGQLAGFLAPLLSAPAARGNGDRRKRESDRPKREPLVALRASRAAEAPSAKPPRRQATSAAPPNPAERARPTTALGTRPRERPGNGNGERSGRDLAHRLTATIEAIRSRLSEAPVAPTEGQPSPAGRPPPKMPKEGGPGRGGAPKEDAVFDRRVRLLRLAEEIGVRPACRAMGVHHSTYYRLKATADERGIEALRARERRRPRMPNQIGRDVEERIIAFSLSHPEFGPRRIATELARPERGGIRISEHGVWRVLSRFDLNTRTKRLAEIARRAEDGRRNPPAPGSGP